MKTVTVRLTRTVHQTKTMTLEVPVTYDDAKSFKDPVMMAKDYVRIGEEIGRQAPWIEQSVTLVDYPGPTTDGEVLVADEKNNAAS